MNECNFAMSVRSQVTLTVASQVMQCVRQQEQPFAASSALPVLTVAAVVSGHSVVQVQRVPVPMDMLPILPRQLRSS